MFVRKPDYTRRVGQSKSGQHMVTDRHHRVTHTRTYAHISKCSIESVVYSVGLSTAQEKLHETPCLLQRSVRLLPDLTWIHLSTYWPNLTWMSHSLVFGPRVLFFFSLQVLFQHALVIALTSRRMDRGVRANASLCIRRGVLLHIWERLCKVICVF